MKLFPACTVFIASIGDALIANKLSLEPHTCTHTCRTEGIFVWRRNHENWLPAHWIQCNQSTAQHYNLPINAKAAISAESRGCRVGRCQISVPPLTMAAGPTTACFPFRLGCKICCRTCRHGPWRQVPRVTWGACRHTSFANSFARWSFPAFRSTRWSVLSKIHYLPTL